jgi:hypothetical protein
MPRDWLRLHMKVQILQKNDIISKIIDIHLLNNSVPSLMLCRPVVSCLSFGEAQEWFDPEDGNINLLRNFVNFLPGDAAQHARRSDSSKYGSCRVSADSERKSHVMFPQYHNQPT